MNPLEAFTNSVWMMGLAILAIHAMGLLDCPATATDGEPRQEFCHQVAKSNEAHMPTSLRQNQIDMGSFPSAENFLREYESA